MARHTRRERVSPVRPDVAGRLFYRHRYRVVAAAAALALIAGFVNGVLIALAGQPVSHLTGTVARVSQDVVAGRALDLALVVPVFGAFFVGAAASGAIVGTRRLLPGRRYGGVLVLEGLLIAGSGVALGVRPLVGVVLAAAACGLQNGMAASFYGVIVRTTHLSGIITDLAVLTGHWLRRRPVEGWRALFQSSVIAAFAAGGVLGALGGRRGGPLVLLAPATLCVAGGLVYARAVSQHRRARVARCAGRRARGARPSGPG